MKKISINEWMFGLIFLFMMVGASIYPNYAADTYATLDHPAEAAVDMLTRNGRPVTALIYELSVLLHIEGITLIWTYTILGIGCLYLAIMLYENSLHKYISNDILRCLIATLAICNIYIIEYMLFLEKIAFMLAILCAVIAYRQLQVMIEENRRSYFFHISIIVFSLIACVNCYQPTLSLFIVLLLPIILRKNIHVREKLKWLATCSLMYGLAGVANLAILSLSESTRTDSTCTLYEIIKSFFILPLNTIHTCGIMPKWFWIGIVIIIAGAILSASKKVIGRWNALINITVIGLLTEICVLIPFILGVGSYIPRVLYVIAYLPMILVVYGYTNHIFNGTRSIDVGKESKLMMIFLTLILIVTSCSFNQIYKDKYITNALDEYRCHIIGEAIREYEHKSGKTIRRIAFYEDQQLDEYNLILKTNPHFRYSAFKTFWSDLNAINYYLGTNYTRCDEVEEISKQFKKQDWKCMSNKQLIFDGETLHICNY